MVASRYCGCQRCTDLRRPRAISKRRSGPPVPIPTVGRRPDSLGAPSGRSKAWRVRIHCRKGSLESDRLPGVAQSAALSRPCAPTVRAESGSGCLDARSLARFRFLIRPDSHPTKWAFLRWRVVRPERVNPWWHGDNSFTATTKMRLHPPTGGAFSGKLNTV